MYICSDARVAEYRQRPAKEECREGKAKTKTNININECNDGYRNAPATSVDKAPIRERMKKEHFVVGQGKGYDASKQSRSWRIHLVAPVAALA